MTVLPPPQGGMLGYSPLNGALDSRKRFSPSSPSFPSCPFFFFFPPPPLLLPYHPFPSYPRPFPSQYPCPEIHCSLSSSRCSGKESVVICRIILWLEGRRREWWQQGGERAQNKLWCTLHSSQKMFSRRLQSCAFDVRVYPPSASSLSSVSHRVDFTDMHKNISGQIMKKKPSNDLVGKYLFFLLSG